MIKTVKHQAHSDKQRTTSAKQLEESEYAKHKITGRIMILIEGT